MLPTLAPTFEAALRDTAANRPEARRRAAERLGSPPPGEEEAASRALRPLLDDPVWAVRRASVLSAGHLGDAGALPVLLARFEDGEPAVREAAVIAAGRIGGPEATAAVREALESPHPEMRFQATVSYAELCPAEADRPLSALLRDPDAEVRANAATALGLLWSRHTTPGSDEGRKEAVDGVAAVLGDEEPAPRREAALALSALADPRAVPVLAEALGDPERAIAAALALGEIGGPDALSALVAQASRHFASLHLRAAAGASLARLGDARGVAALRSVLTAFRSDGRGFAAQLIGEHRLIELAEDLSRLADNPRGADPEVVAVALGALAPESEPARSALLRMAGGEGAGAAAARALSAEEEA